jgi:hypothetical protein
MSTHTPGPWQMDDEHFEDVYAESGELVVAAYPFVDAKRPEGERIAEQKANARLIAAAPELLEALDLALGLSKGKYSPEAWDDWLEKADTAIRKAKGSSPAKEGAA